MKKAQYIAMWAAVVSLVAAQPVQADSLSVGPLPAKEAVSITKGRAQSIPALRYMPRETYGVAAVGKEYAPILAEAVVKRLCADLPASDAARSVSSAAVSLGKGGERVCQAAMEVQNCLQGLEATNQLRQGVACAGAEAIQSAAMASLQGILGAQLKELTERLDSMSGASVYVVFTAAKGQEEAFRQFENQLCRSLSALVPEGGESAQAQGDSVLAIPLDRLACCLVEDLELAADKRRDLLAELAKHKLYIISRQEAAVLRIALTLDRAETAWPSDSAQSLLVAPELNGMDAHAKTAELTVWCPAALQACILKSGSMCSELEPMKKLFSDLAGSVPSEARAFNAAATGVETLCGVMRQLPASKRPMTLQIWRRDREKSPGTSCGNIGVDFRTDACGASFVQGKIMRQSLAASSAIYLETTGFVDPNRLDCSGVPGALLDIVSGIYLVLNEEFKDQAGMGMMLMQQFRPQILGVWENLTKINRSLSYPMTLVITLDEEKNVGGGLRLTVTDRAAIIESWNDLIRNLKSIAGAMAMPPDLLDHLPVRTQPTQDGAMRYTLDLPLANCACQPQMILGESKLMLAGDSVLADALSKDDGDGRPFCGVCFELDMDALSSLVEKAGNEGCKPSGRVQGEAVVQDGMLHITMDVAEK